MWVFLWSGGVFFYQNHLKDNQFFSLALVILNDLEMFSEDFIAQDDLPKAQISQNKT